MCNTQVVIMLGIDIYNNNDKVKILAIIYSLSY